MHSFVFVSLFFLVIPVVFHFNVPISKSPPQLFMSSIIVFEYFHILIQYICLRVLLVFSTFAVTDLAHGTAMVERHSSLP